MSVEFFADQSRAADIEAILKLSHGPAYLVEGVQALYAFGVTIAEMDTAFRALHIPVEWCGSVVEHIPHRRSGMLCLGGSSPAPRADGHELLVHPPGYHNTNDSGYSCMFCEGGLSACVRCGAFEGAWPDECPGAMMTHGESDAVYSGSLNYRAGEWRSGECCQTMRPSLYREEYLAEHGYRQDETGHWVKIDEASG